PRGLRSAARDEGRRGVALLYRREDRRPLGAYYRQVRLCRRRGGGQRPARHRRRLRSVAGGAVGDLEMDRGPISPAARPANLKPITPATVPEIFKSATRSYST